MKTKRLYALTIGICTSIIVSCGLHSTYYGPLYYNNNKEYTGGYSSTTYKKNNYVVVFSSNGYTSATTTYIYCLFRCSEIALENNKKYFIITNQDDLTDVSIQGRAYGHIITTQNITKPSVKVEIALSDTDVGGDYCFNAQEYIKYNKDKIYPSKFLIKERGENWLLYSE